VLFARYLLPLVPYCCLLASPPGKKRAIHLLFIAIACVSVVDMGLRSWERDRLFLTEDTRTEAWRWVSAFPPTTAPVVVAAEPNAFPFREAALAGSRVVNIDYDLAELRAKGVKYVALSDRMTRRYRQAREHYPRENRFYDELAGSARQAALFTPYPDLQGTSSKKIRSGPLIVVYELLN
jgi:hypothetical protein